MKYFGIESAIRRFEQLDDDLLSLVPFGERAEMTIVGGSALMMLGLTASSRLTTDIDVMDAALVMSGILERYDMNQHVMSFRFRLPDKWLTRRQRIPFEGAVLDVFAPSNEDLAITKLDAYREVDRKDLKDMARSGKLDFNLLEEIISDDTELRVNYDTEEEWESFRSRYNEFLGKHRYIHCTPSCGQFPPAPSAQTPTLLQVVPPLARTDLGEIDPQSVVQAINRYFPRFCQKYR